mmetsp:Transcript_30253/g.60446  ORF Transcript_30253/g.60446 Transcript_30253/m.60446 type:complete len:250 (-) Transcript_30253:130-879(-)
MIGYATNRNWNTTTKLLHSSLNLHQVLFAFLEKHSGLHFLEKSISSDKVVVDHSSNRQHSQTPVLDFLQLQIIDLRLALSLHHAHGIKPKRTGRPILIGKHGLHGHIPIVRPPFLNARRAHDLKHGAHTDDLRSQVGVVDVHVGVHGEVDKLGRHEAGSGEHGHAAVLDFGFHEPLGVEVVGEAEGVEAHAAHVAVEVGGGGEEGHGFGHLGREGGCGLASGSRGKSGSRSDEGSEDGKFHHGDGVYVM